MTDASRPRYTAAELRAAVAGWRSNKALSSLRHSNLLMDALEQAADDAEALGEIEKLRADARAELDGLSKDYGNLLGKSNSYEIRAEAAEAALAEAREEIDKLKYTIRLAHYWSKHSDRPQDCFNVLNNATAALGTLEAHHSFNPTRDTNHVEP